MHNLSLPVPSALDFDSGFQVGIQVRCRIYVLLLLLLRWLGRLEQVYGAKPIFFSVSPSLRLQLEARETRWMPIMHGLV